MKKISLGQLRRLIKEELTQVKLDVAAPSHGHRLDPFASDMDIDADAAAFDEFDPGPPPDDDEIDVVFDT